MTIGGNQTLLSLEIFPTNLISYTLKIANLVRWRDVVIEGTFLQQLPRSSTAWTCLPRYLLPLFRYFWLNVPMFDLWLHLRAWFSNCQVSIEFLYALYPLGRVGLGKRGKAPSPLYQQFLKNHKLTFMGGCQITSKNIFGCPAVSGVAMGETN